MRAGGKIQTGSAYSGNRLPQHVFCYECWTKTLRGSTGIAVLLSVLGVGVGLGGGEPCKALELC